MTSRKWLLAQKWFAAGVCVMGVMAAIVLTSCKAGKNSNQQSAVSNQQSATNSESATNADAAQPGEAGIEKVKPAPGTGNVQGKVSYNSKPVENIEVKLCETFSRFLGGCGGQTYT